MVRSWRAQTNETNPGATASVVPVTFDSRMPRAFGSRHKNKMPVQATRDEEEQGEKTKTKKKPKGGGTVAFV